MIPIHIHIGEVRTLSVENWQIVPDDRQQLLEIVGGAVVQDFGHITEGDRISCTVVVSASDWEKIKGDWYYFKDSGRMATGWHKIKGTWYFFASNGVWIG